MVFLDSSGIWVQEMGSIVLYSRGLGGINSINT